jgi:hypothetical protein
MDFTAKIEDSEQGITLDERKYLCQQFDNLVVEKLAELNSYGAQSLSESNK